jgi:hypothetical protein
MFPLTDSIFFANTPIILEDTIRFFKQHKSLDLRRILEVSSRVSGGAVHSSSLALIINGCLFLMNEANFGGALHISNNQLGNSSMLLIGNSSFYFNQAGIQASTILFFNDLVGMQAFISDSTFISNEAKCM